MTVLTPQKIGALCAAAELRRNPDGTFARKGLLMLAQVNRVSERTLMRALANGTKQTPTTSTASAMDPDLEERLRLALELDNGDEAMLLALTVGAGNKQLAHQWAVANIGYVKGYRTFVRDIQRLDPALVAGARGGFKRLVEERIYLTSVIPHRNHTWFIDHTMADFFVLPDRGDTPFHPWITVIVDGATNAYMALEAWDGHLNTERFTQVITRAAVGDQIDRDGRPTFGGLPRVLTFDNAKEHLALGVEEGCVRLGIIGAPTTPRHSWENGRAETAHGAVNRSFLATLPGSTSGGERPDGTPRWAPPAGRTADAAPRPERWPTDLLRMSQFQELMEEFRIRRNATVRDRNGLTPMEKWHDDPTPLTFMDPNLMLANLTVTDRPHTVNKAGIRFRGQDYLCPELAPYRRKKLTVRYLATVREWIEVFDGETYVGRAWLATHLGEAERARILLERGRTERVYRRVEHQARQHRNHVVDAVNEGWAADDLPAEPALASAFEPDGVEVTRPALPVVRTATRRRAQKVTREHENAQSALADKMFSEGFSLTGDLS